MLRGGATTQSRILGGKFFFLVPARPGCGQTPKGALRYSTFEIQYSTVSLFDLKSSCQKKTEKLSSLEDEDKIQLSIIHEVSVIHARI